MPSNTENRSAPTTPHDPSTHTQREGEAMPSTTETHTHPSAGGPPLLTPALQALEAELVRASTDDLEPINLDVVAAAAIAIGAAPKIRAHRDAIAARFGQEAARTVDRLELLAQAAQDAHAAHTALSVPGALDQLAAELAEEKNVLLAEAQCLVDRRLMRGELLSNLAGGQSYRGLYFDVAQLVVAFRHSQATIAGRSPVEPADVDRIATLAERFGAMVATRDAESDGLGASAASLRARAYTLLVRSYDELRRHLGFLRWHQGDVDEIAPSLWSGRGRRRETSLATGLAPAPSPNPIPPGMPGASPFITES